MNPLLRKLLYNQTSIEAQELPTGVAYRPGGIPADAASPPNNPIPLAPNTTTFVVTNYDAKPTNAQLQTLTFTANAVNAQQSIPAGYVGVLRQIRASAYLESNFGSNFAITDRWGFPNVDTDLRFDLIINGSPQPTLSNLLIPEAAVKARVIECYLPVEPQALIYPLIRPGPDSLWGGTLFYMIEIDVDLLLSSGVPTDDEPANKRPLPVDTSAIT